MPISKKGWRSFKQSAIADLRHRVQVQAPDDSVRDASGQVAPTWVTVATVWARVEPVSGRKDLMSGQVQADVTHRVLMRPELTIRPNMRLIWLTGPNNNVLAVLSALPTEGIAESIELLCMEEV